MIKYILILSLFTISCVPKNNNKVLPKKNTGTTIVSYPNDNSFEILPNNPICNLSFQVVINNICVNKEQTRNCTKQPNNSINGQEKTFNGGINWTSCSDYYCKDGYVLSNGYCLPKNQKRTCANQPINSIGGYEFSYDGGVKWTSCQQIQCLSNSTLVNGNCSIKAQSRICVNQPLNTINGLEKTINGGLTWTKCEDTICKEGYKNINNNCILQSLKRTCVNQPINSIEGYELSSNGIDWGKCIDSKCKEGYTGISNICVALVQNRNCISQPENSYGGMEVSYNGGITFNTCEQYNCKNGYKNVNNSCVVEVAPNQYEIEPYITKFKNFAQKYDVQLYEQYEIIFSETLPIGQLGRCESQNIDKIIFINKKWWFNVVNKNVRREIMLFHELGHCLINRGHTNELKATTSLTIKIAKSIMFPNIIDPVFYVDNYDYYIEELFTKNINQEFLLLNQKKTFDDIDYFADLSLPFYINIHKHDKYACHEELFQF